MYTELVAGLGHGVLRRRVEVVLVQVALRPRQRLRPISLQTVTKIIPTNRIFIYSFCGGSLYPLGLRTCSYMPFGTNIWSNTHANIE